MNIRICLFGRVAYVESLRRDGVGTLVAVELEGWNSIPVGYGAQFDLHGAPWWLRWLSPQPGLTDAELAFSTVLIQFAYETR